MNTRVKIFDRAIYWTNGIILGLVVGIGVQFVFAWTAPTATPPSNNTQPPITTSAVEQIKSGILGVTGLKDANDPSYYVDPNGHSRINQTEANIYYDHNTGYYMNLDGHSRINQTEANIYYDHNTGYYMNLDGWSNINALQILGDTNVPWPVNGDDIASKAYVDSSVGGSLSNLYLCPRSFGCDDGRSIVGNWASYGCTGQLSLHSTCVNTWSTYSNVWTHCTSACTYIGQTAIR